MCDNIRKHICVCDNMRAAEVTVPFIHCKAGNWGKVIFHFISCWSVLNTFEEFLPNLELCEQSRIE